MSARNAPPEQIPVLVHERREDILRALLENPRFEEIHLCLMLGRADLPATLIEEITRHREFMTSYRVKRALAFHHNITQTLGLALVRELYAHDLVALSFTPSSHPALRHVAEELVLARLPQLPPALKTVLARRGTPRIMGALLIDGAHEVLQSVLDSPLLNEGHVLKALARIALPEHIVSAIANHSKWSSIYSVKLALIKNSQAPLSRILTFVPSISTPDLQILSRSNSAPSRVQPHIKRELANRSQHGKSFHRGQ